MTTAMDETVTIPIVTAAPTPAQVADILDRAAEVLHANGIFRRGPVDRHQQSLGVPESGCRVDVVGAINIAVTGCPVTWGGISQDHYLLVTAAVTAMQDAVNGGQVGIQEWNDRSPADEVEAGLRSTAAGLRGERA